MSSAEGPHQLPVEVLTELARSAGEDPLPRVFEVVADTIRTTAGYRTMALNIYRPAWDGFETVFVRGPAGIDVLLGDICSRDALQDLLDRATTRLDSIYFFTDAAGVQEGQDEIVASYIPDLPEPESEQGWRADDGLVAVLRDGDGEPLAFVSVDEPASGLRPEPDQLEVMRQICAFAEQALRAAQRAETAEADVRLRAHLAEISPAITACGTVEELQATTIAAILEHFGFGRGCIYRVSDRDLVLADAGGWTTTSPPSSLSLSERVRSAVSGADPEAVLLPAAEIFGDDPELTASQANGAGPLAWHDDCLLLPWTNTDGELERLVVIQDPVDRLRPQSDRLQVLQLLVELAASVAGGIAHRSRLDRLASYDALTGIRNRRGLEAVIGTERGVALLSCDLDHFKAINDRYGHGRGDLALAAFGTLLRESGRARDIPMRLGGDEFCVVLPETGPEQALAYAERLRAQTESRLAEIIPAGVTVSIGVAVSDGGRPDPGALMRAADTALYRAKQAGRNRVESSAADAA